MGHHLEKRLSGAAATLGEQPGTSIAPAHEVLLGGFWNHAPIGVALIDRDFRFVRINPFLAGLNSKPVEEHIGKAIDEVVPHLAPLLRPLMRHVLETGEPILNHELRGQEDQGSDVRNWLATYYPVHSETGNVDGVGVLVIESTSLKRAEAALLDKTHELQEANARLELLSRASAILSSSLEVEATLQSVARMAVPAFADWCLVDLVDPDGTLRRVASAHSDVCKSELANAFRTLRVPPRAESELRRHGVARVLATGEPDVVAQVTDEIIGELALDETHATMLRGLEMSSYISVPLTARGNTLGVLNFATCGEHRKLDLEDLSLARELASRAGLAIDNARLFHEAHAAREHAETEQARAEVESERAKAAAHAKDEFLSILSHELRTPLTSACGWLQLYRGDKLDEATRQFAIETVERALMTQARLVNELLDSSQLAGGRMTLEAVPVALAPLVKETLENLEAAAAAKNISFESSLDDVKVSGEAGRLQQIVWNLVANAVKFSPMDGVVTVHIDRFENAARVVVTDEGQGIEPSFMPHVFEPFRQAENSATRANGGLGLGLPVARALAEMHGGTIEVRSAGTDRGASFTLSLPLLEEDKVGATTRANEVGDGNLSGEELLRGIRVLVVEDDEGTRGWMQLALRNQGAIVVAAAAMREGLDRYFAESPDVVVSDISLPDGDGYTLMERIRESEDGMANLSYGAARHVPAVALTAHAAATDRLRALAAGFQLHIPKPVAPNELVLTVAAVAGRSIAARL